MFINPVQIDSGFGSTTKEESHTMHTRLYSALCTPLKDDDTLDVAALAIHLDDQWRHGIAGVLIGGSMGLMQLLEEATYCDLVRYGVGMSHGRGEVLVGAGDASLTRTLHRIEFVEQFDVDGIVVLAPYFETLEQPDLVKYFRALADRSKKPIYLYDLPGVTRTRLELETVLELSQHPNIRGIKCSSDLAGIWRLMSWVGEDFRVIPAQATMVDLLVRAGIRHNLDGIFSVVPDLTASIAVAAEDADNARATAQQRKLTDLLQLISTKYAVMPACSAILQARGIPARIHPRPQESFTGDHLAQFLDEPLLRDLLAAPVRRQAAETAPAGPIHCRRTGSDGQAAGVHRKAMADGNPRSLQVS
jgi:4-hydroxy-tetrahydrodipicolinate synthase